MSSPAVAGRSPPPRGAPARLVATTAILYVETNIILTQRPYSPPRAVIWAHEVDDVDPAGPAPAPPFEPLPKLDPREVILSRPEVVMEQPAVRRALPSVELDTVHFGFNESFVSEEDIVLSTASARSSRRSSQRIRTKSL